MQNISYFCIVKRINIIYIKFVVSCILLFFSSIATVSAQNGITDMDSVEVSLLTCSPHQEVYSLYGHTAIRYYDPHNHIDYAFNYGMFNFHKPYFILRFVFGLTDYELGAMPFDIFKEEYASYGSQVTQQVLNLTAEEKMALRDALGRNYKPENRVYRYNYFKDNCTTRARDIIVRCISGNVQYDEDEEYTASYREMTHECNAQHPWAQFGNDMALGMAADFKTDYAQQQFLPSNLQSDFNKATIHNTDGSTRRLVSRTDIIVKPGIQVIQSEFPLTPTECSLIVLFITVLISLYEYIKKKITWWYDSIMMVVCGLAGVLILALFFSEHPTTSTNLLILILNPVPLFFVPRMIKRARSNKKDDFFTWSIIPISIMLITAATGLQDFPMAMNVLALCLLLRCISHIIKRGNKQKI